MEALHPEGTSPTEAFSPQDPLLDPDPQGSTHADCGSHIHAITCPGILHHSNGRATFARLVLFGCTVAVAALHAADDSTPFALSRAFSSKGSLEITAVAVPSVESLQAPAKPARPREAGPSAILSPQPWPDGALLSGSVAEFPQGLDAKPTGNLHQGPPQGSHAESPEGSHGSLSLAASPKGTKKALTAAQGPWSSSPGPSPRAYSQTRVPQEAGRAPPKQMQGRDRQQGQHAGGLQARAAPAPKLATDHTGPDLRNSIVGSRLKTGAQVKAFRARWECVTSLNTSHWAYEPKPRVLSWPEVNFTQCGKMKGYLGLPSNEAVVRGQYTAANWTVAESLKYVWKPRRAGSCGFKVPSFASLDAAGFCKALQKTGGSLFVVGDSLSAQFFLSLRYQLQTFGASVEPLSRSPICLAFLKQLGGKHQRSLPSWPGCERFMFCGKSRKEGGVEAYSSGSLYLKQVHEGVDANSGAGPPTENAFGDEMVASNASVVLLNRGAHFAPTKEFIPELNHTLHELRRMLPKALIFYRSTPHGHPNCSQYEKPLESPMDTVDMPFNWGKFEEQNKIAKGIVESVGGVYMDVSPMMSVRPDWHIIHHRHRPDCLHHCLPGPQGDWAKLFGGMLQDLV